MKNIKPQFILILLSFMLLQFCSKGDEGDQQNLGTLTYPIAAFSYSGNDHPAPVTIEFVNSSEYSDQFEWNFGDGTTSTAQTPPPHHYFNTTLEVKNFTVSLKATDSGSGLWRRVSKVIAVQPSK